MGVQEVPTFVRKTLLNRIDFRLVQLESHFLESEAELRFRLEAEIELHVKVEEKVHQRDLLLILDFRKFVFHLYQEDFDAPLFVRVPTIRLVELLVYSERLGELSEVRDSLFVRYISPYFDDLVAGETEIEAVVE